MSAFRRLGVVLFLSGLLLLLSRPAEAQITFVDSGAVTSTTSSNPSCALPSPTDGIQAGDVGLWHSRSEENVNHSYPTGWTEVSDLNQGGTCTNCVRHSWAWKRFAGPETGSLTVTISGSLIKQCKISLWRGVRATGNPHEAVTTGQATSSTVNPAAVSITNSGDMIVALIAVGDDNALDAMSGGSGVGTVTEAYEHRTTTGNDSNIVLNYASSTTTGSVDLGSDGTGSSDPWLTYTIALVPVSCGAVSDASYVAAAAPSGTTSVTAYWSSANPVLILRKTAPFAGEAPNNGHAHPAGSSVGAATVVWDGSAGMAGMTCTAATCTDTGLTNGTTYYYKVFPRAGNCYAAGTGGEVNAKPVAATTGVAWSYTLAGGSMLKAGIAGDGTVHTTSNASRILSLNTGDGTQTGAPVATNQPIQSWLTWLPGVPVTAAWYDLAWASRKKIRIDKTKVGSGGVTDFPVLISLTDTDLKTTAQASGNDILFTSSNGTTKLSHEIERYTSSTGELIAWVKVPSIPSTADTDLYMYYGNAAASNQQNASDVWSNGYVSVWHLRENPAGSAPQIQDSTLNVNHGTTQNMTAADLVGGRIGGGLNFKSGTSGSGSLVNTGDQPEFQLSTYSWSMWIKGSLPPVCNPAAPGNEQPIWNADSQFNFSWGHTGCTFNQAAAHTDGTWRSAQIQTTLYENTWYNISATYGSGQLKVYLNGVLEQTTAHGAPITAAGSFAIGNAVGFTHFNGQLDEVRISNAVRSAAWLQTGYNNQNSPSTFYSVGAENASGVVIGSDQSGRVYSVDVATLATMWTKDLSASGADFFQATPAAQLRDYSNATFQATHTDDLIFVGTRNAGATDCGNSTTNNKVFALRASDGTVAWTFNPASGGVCPNQVDWNVGMPYVDYARNRLYVTSRAGSSGTQTSLWVIDTVTGALVTPPAPLTLGHLETSPTLRGDGSTIYVGSWDGADGTFYAIDATTLAVKWNLPLGAAGNIKGFVWEDYSSSGRLYFSNGSDVRCVQDDGASGSVCAGWTVSAVAGSSTLLLLDKIYVGSSDGKLHQIDPTTGVEEKVFPAAGTLDGTQVGDVSTETVGEVFVGTAAGKLYRIPLPLP